MIDYVNREDLRAGDDAGGTLRKVSERFVAEAVAAQKRARKSGT